MALIFWRLASWCRTLKSRSAWKMTISRAKLRLVPRVNPVRPLDRAVLDPRPMSLIALKTRRINLWTLRNLTFGFSRLLACEHSVVAAPCDDGGFAKLVLCIWSPKILLRHALSA